MLAALNLVTAGAAEISAQLDRNRIVEGETVRLVIQTDDPQQNLDGDFSVLEADFALLDRRTETQMSIMNGRQSAVVRLILTLEPRRSGELTLPALRFGNLSTAPQQLTVDAAPTPQPGDVQPVFIEVEVDPSEGPWYVHAQLGLTVRVFYQQSLTEAAISQPEPTPAAVRLLDEVPFQADRGGERYRVLERHYAIFPERSGMLEIPPMKLSGRLVERRSDGLWQPTVRGRRIEVSSEPLELLIQPKPASFTGANWVPARALTLNQTVSASDSLTVGEPVTRTVIVDATGLEENMITEPPWPEVTSARIYPDQPQGINRNDGKWELGHKEFRYAVVPEVAGELVLPELKMEWWDTVNDRMQTATLPEQRLKVLPSTIVPENSEPVAAAIAPPNPTPAAGDPQSFAREPSYWKWIAVLFAALWLGTSALLWKRTSEPKAPRRKDGGMEPTESAILGRLKSACADGQSAPARTALLQWLRQYGPTAPSGSLLEFAADLPSGELREGLLRLDATGFRPDQSASWNGAAFWTAFAAWKKHSSRQPQEKGVDVTDLYADVTSRG